MFMGFKSEHFLNPFHGFFYVLKAVESAETDESFPTFSKAGTGCTDHAGFFQKKIKKGPGVLAAVDPDVR